MTIRVGVIGTGGIGTDHGQQARPSDRRLDGVRGDGHQPRPRQGGRRPSLGGARVYDDGLALIASDEVDAVLITSIGETHAEYMLASIAAGKPVLCEKPLAPTTAECEQILDAEVGARQAPRHRRLHAPLRPRLPAGQGVARDAAPSACR